MNVFNRSKALLSPLVKRCVVPERTVFVRGVCGAPTTHSLSHQFTGTGPGCQHRRNEFGFDVSTCNMDLKRYYSELYNENDTHLKSTNGELKVVSREMEDDYTTNQGSSEMFTLDTLVSLLQQENAVDICVIKVAEQIKYAEYFIVVSGLSPRHLRAMALYAIKVYKFLKKDHDPHVKIEGKDAEDWMCIDFGNMVVHFMLPETRELYELEKLWTLRSYDEQLKNMPVETLPEDFVYDAEVTK